MPGLIAAVVLIVFVGAVLLARHLFTHDVDSQRMREDLKKALEAGESGKLADFLALWGDKVPPRMLKVVEQRKKELVRPSAWDKINED